MIRSISRICWSLLRTGWRVYRLVDFGKRGDLRSICLGGVAVQKGLFAEFSAKKGSIFGNLLAKICKKYMNKFKFITVLNNE